MSHQVDHKDRALARLSLFAGLSPEILDALEKSSRVRHFGKGQILCSEGDPGDCLIVLEKGQAKVCRYAADGQEIVLSHVDAPAAIGELALIDGASRSATIVAVSPVTVRLIDRTTFTDLVEREPELAHGLLQALADMVRATNERLVDLQTLDVPGRVAKWLLAHAAQQPPGVGGDVPFTLSQGELASEIGATRVSVNRALKMFERQKSIRLERDRIVLLVPEVLRDHVTGGASEP